MGTTPSHPLLSSHPPVIGPGNATGQPRVGSLRTANAEFEAHVSVRLRPDIDRNLLLASNAGNHTGAAIFTGYPHTFVLGRMDRRAPGPIESAGSGRIGWRGLRGAAAKQNNCGRGHDDRDE